jgi:hypothetical protein
MLTVQREERDARALAIVEHQGLGEDALVHHADRGRHPVRELAGRRQRPRLLPARAVVVAGQWHADGHAGIDLGNTSLQLQPKHTESARISGRAKQSKVGADNTHDREHTNAQQCKESSFC